MSIASLELVSPAAHMTCRRRARCAGSASLCSFAVIASLAVCVGVGYLGLLAAILTATTFVALCVAATRSRWVHRGLDYYSRERARVQRESARRHALSAGPAARQEQYEQLRRIVESIESSDPVEARRLELQELLDHVVQLAAGHQRCLDSLRVAEQSDSQAATPLSEQPPTKRHHDIATRRLRKREETKARLEAIVDEIDCTDDLIRLVAQRTACANLDSLIGGEGEIDRRLAELDDVEAALVQISA